MTKQNKLFIGYRILLLLGTGILFWGGYQQLIVISLISGFFYAVHICANELKNKSPFGGIPNWVTLTRGTGLLLILFFFQSFTNKQLAILGLVLAASDVLDGYLARKLNAQTIMGAYLDEEMDVFYIITFGYILYAKQLTGLYILLPGIAKYMKDLITTIFAVWFSKPIKMPVAKWIAGISFVAFLTPLLLPKNTYPLFTITASSALCLSLLAEMILRFNRLAKNQ